MNQPNEEIISIITPHLEKIRECIVSAWNDYDVECHSIRYKTTPRSRAAIVHDNMKYRIKTSFEGIKGIRYLESRGLFLLIFNDRVCIRFKKLNAKMLSRNIPTQQTLLYINQLELPEIPGITKMIAGYRLDKLQAGIDGIFVTYPRGTRDIPWHLELGVDNVEKIPSRDTGATERKEAIHES
jgi:hypothetical protein